MLHEIVRRDRECARRCFCAGTKHDITFAHQSYRLFLYSTHLIFPARIS
jgi:hypothetical protein